MKGFIQLLEEKKKTLAMLFGRMNPPTAGHEENVHGLKKIAQKHKADPVVIASHSHDAKKNPLDSETKMKHLKRAFPDTNVTSSSKEKPTILHHASDAHKKGYTHLVVVGGGDRVHEYHKLLNHYNGVTGRHGYYKFDHISVKSTGDRKKGVSGSDMRKHAQEGNIEEFKKHVPSEIAKNKKHTEELYHDTRKGLGIHEDVLHGKFKAIFITGGPGSGKDIVIREGIAAQHAIELNTIQIVNYLGNKHNLKEYIRNRVPLIINGSADNFETIAYVKEELEELGYITMMVYVDTNNNVSKIRNEGLRRVVAEAVREDKWNKAQINKVKFYNLFNDFNLFENNNDIEQTEESITDVCDHVSEFLNNKMFSESATEWLLTHYQDNFSLDEQLSMLIRLEENNNDKNINGFGEKTKQTIHNHNRFVTENNCPFCQIDRKRGKQDSVTDGDIAPNSGFSVKTYEGQNPTLTVKPEPRIPNFQKDKEVTKARKNSKIFTVPGRVKTPGVGPEYETRGQGTVYPMSGLGNVTYQEQVSNKYKQVAEEAPSKKFSEFRVSKLKEAIDDPGASDMGVGGVLNGATNKEPMETLAQKITTGITIRKKKKSKED